MVLSQAITTLQEQGYGVIPPEQYRVDIEKDFLALWEQVSPFTMTSLERGYALYKGVEYLCKGDIQGDLVECGVWKGGSCMLMALAVSRFAREPRRILLYDTFQGMTKPSTVDRVAWNGRPLLEKWEEDRKGEKDNFKSWAVGSEEVKKNLSSIDYPQDHFVFVPGDVLKTLDKHVPEAIALLRLDTDWYESTYKELQVLYPRLREKGVLIIDDYGHFTGSRTAVDNYFEEIADPPLLSRIDYTGRITIKH